MMASGLSRNALLLEGAVNEPAIERQIQIVKNKMPLLKPKKELSCLLFCDCTIICSLLSTVEVVGLTLSLEFPI
jgi:hypothetical protein